MQPTTAPPVIRATLPGPLDPRWSRLPGLTTNGNDLTLTPDFWLQFADPTWLLCDWAGVRDNLLNATETSEQALEQTVLNYIRVHSRTTADPAEVLATAWDVYAYLFRDDLLPVPGLEDIGPAELRMLREAAILMSLNKVQATGEIANISPVWFFGVAIPMVFGLDDATGQMLDEVYHSTWFAENRRTESIRAHAALGGRLVHGCQSSPDMTGGVVAPYGTDIAAFHATLRAMRAGWITATRNLAP
jgi:hypothetical protein